MKNWIKVHKKGIIIAISFLILGMIIAPKGTEIKEVVKEVVKVEYTKECEGFAIYKQIKAVDDELILTQAIGLQLASEGFMAISELDYIKLGKVNKAIVALSPGLKKLGEQRVNLIEQLKK